MEQFWSMIRGWSPIGQGLVILISLTLFVALIDKLWYYITVLFRGWPPEHCVEEQEK